MEISTDERFVSSLTHIQTRVGDTRCAFSQEGTRTKLTIEKVDPRVIIDALADVVITDCKSYYISTHIRLPVEDAACRNAFIKALSTFDRDTDKIIVKTLLKSMPNFYGGEIDAKKRELFYLDSFYEFMLDILKSRWDEVCMLANENACYLVCKKTFMELLHFLISNIESKSDREEILSMISHL